MKTVSEKEFYNFIETHLGALESRVVTIGEPASIVYYKKWNKNNVVARVTLNEDDPRSLKKNEYEIME